MKFIINVFLVVLVIHFLLKNLSFNQQDQEQMNTDRPRVGYMKVEQRGESDLEPVRYQNPQDFAVVYKNSPASFNEYDGRGYNTPNFESNIRNVPSFYKINENVECKDSNLCTEKPEYIEQFKQNDISSIGGPSSTADSYYQYKNDMVMNGGQFGDITGHQMSGGLYASVDSPNTILDTCDPYSASNKRDDVRFGMGVLNKVVKESE